MRRDTGTLHHCLHSLGKGEARAFFMQDYNYLRTKEGIWILAVHSIAISMGIRNENAGYQRNGLYTSKGKTLIVFKRHRQSDGPS